MYLLVSYFCLFVQDLVVLILLIWSYVLENELYDVEFAVHSRLENEKSFSLEHGRIC